MQELFGHTWNSLVNIACRKKISTYAPLLTLMQMRMLVYLHEYSSSQNIFEAVLEQF